MSPFKFLLSRIDKIGDVIHTLPMAGLLKQHFPDSQILFLGKTYTQAVIERCTFIDTFLDLQAFLSLNLLERIKFLKDLKINAFFHVFPNPYIAFYAQLAGIPVRTGTSRRWYHTLTCSHPISLSRKNSKEHEALLNLKVLSPLPIPLPHTTQDLIPYYGFCPPPSLRQGKFKLILSVDSSGSAPQWPLSSFLELAFLLPQDLRTQQTRQMHETWQTQRFPFTHITGLSLSQFIKLVSECDGLVSNSTGSGHISAALHKHTLALYPPRSCMLPSRWAPIGPKAQFLTAPPSSGSSLCKTPCQNYKNCLCMSQLSPQAVASILEKWPYL
jgi:heptosyltransferase III